MDSASKSWLVDGLEDGEGEGEVDDSRAETGHVFGTPSPAVLKKSTGETKASNAEPGWLKSFSRSPKSVLESHRPSPDSDEGKGKVEGEGGGEVAMEVQL